MRIAVRDHQNKSAGLRRALHEAGHVLTVHRPEMLLIDHDGPPFYREIIAAYAAQDVLIVLYPHGATSCIAWDGIWSLSPQTAAYLAQSPGEAEIMRSYGFPLEIHVTGWHYCDVFPQRALPARPKRVLFAPIHPLANGFMQEAHRRANAAAFANVLATSCPRHVSVRYLGDLEAAGLWQEPGVEYHQGDPDNSTADIDQADAVVSSGTFAYLAIARGVPTVMYGQAHPADGHSAETVRRTRSWEAYRDLWHYPIDTFEKLRTTPPEAVAAWREKFIGSPVDPENLNRILHRIRTKPERIYHRG